MCGSTASERSMPQARPTALLSPLQSVAHLLHRAGQRADSLFAGGVGDILTPRQFAVLQAVAEADGLSQTGIMAATGIDRSSTADPRSSPRIAGMVATPAHQARCAALRCQAYAGRAPCLVRSRAGGARDGGDAFVVSDLDRTGRFRKSPLGRSLDRLKRPPAGEQMTQWGT
jgi:hypothetical protein